MRGRMMPLPTTLVALAALAVLAGLTACSGSDPAPGPAPSSPAVPTTAQEPQPDFDLALSTPVEDSLYPDVGDPGVDALHYDLDLTWDPTTDTLTADEVLTFRATADASEVRLDFAEPLRITALRLNGRLAASAREGKDLVVQSPVRADRRYRLAITYTGTPQPVRAPTTRDDLLTTGFTIDDEHQVWTMQEPFGAYTWYAVNDHPSDKALYDFALHVPAPWTGIANGRQLSARTQDGVRTTTFHLAEPAAAYLVTLAFGAYDQREENGPGGVPITYWTPAGDDRFDAGLHTAPAAMRWLEKYLGPYPFETAGFVVVDSDSGMETQTLITLGNTRYSTSPAVVLHELAHHWYGDQVTPSDWRDVWMNEGMASYLQLMFTAERDERELDNVMYGYLSADAGLREDFGPPGNYDPTEFGSSNVYYSAALLWHEIRERLGDEAFFSVVRAWPASQDNQSSDRETLLTFLERESGVQLDDLWDAWLLSPTTPEAAFEQ
ncbi:MAG: M1 family metallopeptidase [Nocardioides sp.]